LVERDQVEYKGKTNAKIVLAKTLNNAQNMQDEKE